jgi:hypothetical protein
VWLLWRVDKQAKPAYLMHDSLGHVWHDAAGFCNNKILTKYPRKCHSTRLRQISNLVSFSRSFFVSVPEHLASFVTEPF